MAIWRLPPRTQQPFKGAVTEAYVPPPEPTTANTRSHPLGIFVGMWRRMPFTMVIGLIGLAIRHRKISSRKWYSNS